ncbi:MAG: MFS transporter [Candidatus Levybacteria bacterium]|nr:MFS transporter [Candidatus Levybacteria bacterium]
MNTLRKVLLISDAFYLLSGGLLGPIYALFVTKIGGDLLDASSAFALFMLTAGIVTFLLSIWEDKSKHRRKFVIIGYGIGMLGAIGYLFVNSTMTLFIVQIILGLAVSVKDPAYDALFSNSQKHLALAWGEWETVDYFALSGGAFFGGLIAQYLGFQVLLFCMAFLSVVSFITSMYLLRLKEKDL